MNLGQTADKTCIVNHHPAEREKQRQIRCLSSKIRSANIYVSVRVLGRMVRAEMSPLACTHSRVQNQLDEHFHTNHTMVSKFSLDTVAKEFPFSPFSSRYSTFLKKKLGR